MPSPSGYPGTYLDEVPSSPRTIDGLATGITLFVGCATTGPRALAVQVTSDSHYQVTFGPPDPAHALGDAIAHYFANGGRVAWIVALDGGPPGAASFQAALLACFDPGGPVDAIDRFDLLCVPGESDPATQAALQARCAARRVFFIADCAADATASTLAQGPDARLVGANASYAALYAPWVLVADAMGAARLVPPSGFVAGIYARTDAQRGVWKAPAGSDATLVGATALAIAIDGPTRDAMNSAGIDGLRVLPGRGGLVIWGARTLAAAGGDAQYRYVSVRRLLLYLESSLDAGLRWIVFEPNDERTWALVRASVTDFLQRLWRDGALAGARLDQAAFVRCDRTTMTQADLDEGRLIVEIGVAPVRPAEFIVIRLVFRTAAP